MQLLRSFAINYDEGRWVFCNKHGRAWEIWSRSGRIFRKKSKKNILERDKWLNIVENSLLKIV